jgi:1-deoxy-D-xylulose 5-phosphate reductoisomerase
MSVHEPARSFTILGATGSIGASALDVIGRHPDRFTLVTLTARPLGTVDDALEADREARAVTRRLLHLIQTDTLPA